MHGFSFKRMRGLIQGFYEVWILLAFTHSLINKQWRDMRNTTLSQPSSSFSSELWGPDEWFVQESSSLNLKLEFWKIFAVSVPVPVNLPLVNLSRKRVCFVCFVSCSFVWTLTKVENSNNNWSHNMMLKRQTCYMICYWLKFCGSFIH